MVLISQVGTVRGDHTHLLPAAPQCRVESRCLGTGASYLSLEAWKKQAHVGECSGLQSSWTNWSGLSKLQNPIRMPQGS